MDLIKENLLKRIPKIENIIDPYKDFLQLFRRLVLDDHHLLLGEPVTPKFKEYVRYILNIKFEDGMYHTYYGEMKKVISSFVNYMFNTTDEVIVEADRCSQITCRQELIDLADKTIDVYQDLQIDFAKEYLPVTNEEEKRNYDEITELHKIYMQNLHDLVDIIENFDKQEKVEDFVKNHFKITVNKTYEKFQFGHLYLSLMLSDRVSFFSYLVDT